MGCCQAVPGHETSALGSAIKGNGRFRGRQGNWDTPIDTEDVEVQFESEMVETPRGGGHSAQVHCFSATTAPQHRLAELRWRLAGT